MYCLSRQPGFLGTIIARMVTVHTLTEAPRDRRIERTGRAILFNIEEREAERNGNFQVKENVCSILEMHVEY